MMMIVSPQDYSGCQEQLVFAAERAGCQQVWWLHNEDDDDHHDDDDNDCYDDDNNCHREIIVIGDQQFRSSV